MEPDYFLLEDPVDGTDDAIKSSCGTNEELWPELLCMELGCFWPSDPVEQSDIGIPSRRRLDDDLWLEFLFMESPRFRLKLRLALGDFESRRPVSDDDGSSCWREDERIERSDDRASRRGVDEAEKSEVSVHSP